MPPVTKARKKPAVKRFPAAATKARVKRVPMAARKRSVSAKLPPARRTSFKAEEKLLGVISHYFPKVRAAVIKLKAPVSVGDKIKVKGHTTDFIQEVVSMQVDHVSLKTAKKGDIIGLLVNSRVRSHDVVSKV